jgi:hypothetical protein
MWGDAYIHLMYFYINFPGAEPLHLPAVVLTSLSTESGYYQELFDGPSRHCQRGE